MERECNAGSIPRLAGYQAGTRGGNGGAETKLPSGAGKSRESVENEIKLLKTLERRPAPKKLKAKKAQMTSNNG